jgi:hypothetical protein
MLGDITLGMIVGAAIGGATAYALSGNPFVGAAVGAVLVGTGVAAQKYIELRLEVADHNRNKALADMRRDIERDIENARLTFEDVRTAQNELALATSAAAISTLRKSVDNIERSVKFRDVVTNLMKIYSTTGAIYGDVVNGTELGTDGVTPLRLQVLTNSISESERETMDFLEQLKREGVIR